MLLGSSIFGGTVNLGDVQIQLGDLVRWAFTRSKLTTDQWNALPDLDREILLVHAFYALRKER